MRRLITVLILALMRVRWRRRNPRSPTTCASATVWRRPQARHGGHAFPAALALDSTDYEALWKTARAIANVAKQIDSDQDALKKSRDSMYVEGPPDAPCAANPEGTDGHAWSRRHWARSRTRGKKERVRFAKIIYDEAMEAFALTDHDVAPMSWARGMPR